MLNLITNIIAWFLKNVNMIVGIIGAIGKLAGALINIFQPSKDDLVDKIDSWVERIQKILTKLTEIAKKFKG